MIRGFLRQILRIIQFSTARTGNRGWKPLPSSNAHDLLKAAWISTFIDDGSRVLDVGGGNGRRLMDLSLYVRDLDGVSIDLYEPDPIQATIEKMTIPLIKTFDGKSIPYSENEFDVVLICYVLHHLTETQAKKIICDAGKVGKKRVILLEDSRPLFGKSYRLRNWAHATEANLEYETQSTDFARNFKHSFKTHGEWTTLLESLQMSEKVTCIPLDRISNYRHHTMFVVDLAT